MRKPFRHCRLLKLYLFSVPLLLVTLTNSNPRFLTSSAVYYVLKIGVVLLIVKGSFPIGS